MWSFTRKVIMKVRTIGTNTINDLRAVFIRVSKKSWFCIYYATPLAEKKNSHVLFIQSRVKPKPILPRSHTFPRAWRQLHVFALSFDWFTELSVCFVIGQSGYFGFGNCWFY